MSGVQKLTLPDDAAEQRLDRWLRKRLPQLSQGRIEKLCRKGEIRLDGGRVRPAHRLAPGRELRLPPLPDAPAPPPEPPEPAADDTAMIRGRVIHKDDHLIALDKPPGLPCQGGSGLGNRHIDALTGALMFGYRERPVLAHRLDRDTSGVLLLARTARIARKLGVIFRGRETAKTYWALAAGLPKPRQGTIRYGLVKDGPRGAERMRPVPPDAIEATEGARTARTDYAVIAAAGTRLSWLALRPVTGRTHQLRAHLAAIGHPIIGDGKYGATSRERAEDGWGAGAGRALSGKLHLHARSLALPHPITGALLEITADLPDHMARSWTTLEWRADAAGTDPFATRKAGRR